MSMTTKKKGLGSKGLGIEALINNKMEDFKEVSLRQQTGEAVNELDINLIEPTANSPANILTLRRWRNWRNLSKHTA